MMMLRLVSFKPSGVGMIINRSMSRYTETSKCLRLKVTVKPKDPASNFRFLLSKNNDKPKETIDDLKIGHSGNNFTANAFFQKKDLDDKDKLHLYILLRKRNGTLEYIPLSIDTSKPMAVIPWQNGSTDIDIFTRIDTDPDVKLRGFNELCRKEEEFVSKRKRVVYNNMSKDMTFKSSVEGKDEGVVPTIAIIGSGGGLRAAIGMCGAMLELEKQGILEYSMYTAGLSGSLWYLMLLYAYDTRLNPQEVYQRTRQICSSLRTFHLFKIQYKLMKSKPSFHSWLDFFNLKNELALGISILQKQFRSKWSEQAGKLEDGNIPLPFLAALLVRGEEDNTDCYEWIEMSPYEMFIPNYGAAIDMENFGDDFYKGFSTNKKGLDVIGFLQGICCNGYAEVKNYSPPGGKWYQSSRVLNWIRFTFTYWHRNSFRGVPNLLLGMEAIEPHFDDRDSKTDTIDVKSERMHLVDASCVFNSPYLTVLRPSRKVDVIISFDFSNRGKDSNWPFEELEKTSEWAKKRKIPFPEIDSQLEKIRRENLKTGNYEEMYVFPGGDNSPTIVHFVMINKSFARSDLPMTSDFNILPDYADNKFLYTVEEFDNLSRLIMFNVRLNRKKILDCILSKMQKT